MAREESQDLCRSGSLACTVGRKKDKEPCLKESRKRRQGHKLTSYFYTRTVVYVCLSHMHRERERESECERERTKQLKITAVASSQKDKDLNNTPNLGPACIYKVFCWATVESPISQLCMDRMLRQRIFHVEEGCIF